MGRLIRLDRTGHTTLTEWSATDPEAHETAAAAFRRELDSGMLASAPQADGTAEVVRELPVDAELVVLRPWTRPVGLGCFAQAWIVPWLQARRGARSVVPLGGERGAGRGSGTDGAAEGVALGLLGDLVGHRVRELVGTSGLAMHRGKLGVWLGGQRGALMGRRGGWRVG